MCIGPQCAEPSFVHIWTLKCERFLFISIIIHKISVAHTEVENKGSLQNISVISAPILETVVCNIEN